MTTHADAESLSFLIEGAVNVQVTVTEDEGALRFDLAVLDDTGSIGDLNGLFFDIFDDGLADGLKARGEDVSAQEFGADSVSNLGKGINVRGEAGNDGDDGAFDCGVAFGGSGLGDGEIRETSFLLSHESVELYIDDIAGEDFAVRLTSVGPEDGPREASLKMAAVAPEAGHDPKETEEGDGELVNGAAPDMPLPPLDDENAYEVIDPEDFIDPFEDDMLMG